MLHPIYGTVLGHPELVGEHLANYGALFKEELATATRGMVSRLIAGVVAAVSALLALGLIGIAFMLGALHGFHWALVAVPGIALLIAAVCGWIAARPSQIHPFTDLQSQVDADLHALRLASEARHAR